MSRIHRCSPVFAVLDPPKLADYYVKTFGFDVVGDPIPEYAIVSREGYEIHFHLAAGQPSGNQGDEDYRGGAYFVVEDPDALHEELSGRGATVHCPLEDRPYGMRDFSVRDPEGYLLCFGKALA